MSNESLVNKVLSYNRDMINRLRGKNTPMQAIVDFREKYTSIALDSVTRFAYR